MAECTFHSKMETRREGGGGRKGEVAKGLFSTDSTRVGFKILIIFPPLFSPSIPPSLPLSIFNSHTDSVAVIITAVIGDMGVTARKYDVI